MASRPVRAISLVSAVYGFVFLTAVLVGAATAYLLFDRVAFAKASATQEAVKIRGKHAAIDLARVFDQDFHDRQYLADHLAQDDPATLQGQLDLMAGNRERIVWAGFAGTDGIVIRGSHDVLQGADVSARPWFRRGLVGNFAGDVQDAILLNAILGGTTDDPIRLLDLSAPVRDANGQVLGVLSLRINFAWAEAFLTELAQSLELDFYLVSQDGSVIIATDGSEPGPRDLPSFRAAASGVAYSGSEIWPDGIEYFTTVIADVTYPDGDLPSFGWRLIARIGPHSFDAAASDLDRVLTLVLMVAGLSLVILTIGFNLVFIRPFGVLADNAKRIADGSDEYPLDLRRTRELQQLSAALAQLQGHKN